MASRFTERLRLEPIGPAFADDFLGLHRDAAIGEWYVDEIKWTPDEARQAAEGWARAWEVGGAGKWLAYERDSGELIGRGGLSRQRADASDARQIRALLPDDPWVDETVEAAPGVVLVRHWLEVGWAVRGVHRRKGYASEIGRASLDFAFDDLEAKAVVAFSERHNHASLRVMERIGMHQVGEIAHPGLVEGRHGVHPDAPFAVYAVVRDV